MKDRFSQDRRNFLKLMTLGATMLIIEACKSTVEPSLEPTQEHADLAWPNLQPLEKISRLESGQHSFKSEAEVLNELVAATAEFYVQQVPSRKNAEQLKASVHFVDKTTLIREAEQDSIARGGRGFTQAEEEYFTFGAITTVGGEIFVDSETLKNNSKDFLQRQPEIAKQLDGRNPFIVIGKSVLIHEYNHINQSEETFNQPFRLPDGQIVEKVQGFEFIGKEADGISILRVQGAREAMTDFAASIIVAKDQNVYAAINERYINGTFLLRDLNRKAEVSNVEFLEYYFGSKPLSELLTRWATIKNQNNPIVNDGLFALFTIGLYVDGHIPSPQEAQQSVDLLLNNNLY